MSASEEEPLYCCRCGLEECACPGEWPGEGPYCHVCGVIPALGKACHFHEPGGRAQPCEGERGVKTAQKPCSKCSERPRGVGSPWCLLCKAEHGRVDYARRKEELRARQRAWLDAHPERVKERTVAYRQARRDQNKSRYWRDPAHARAQSKRWVRENKEKRREIARAWYVANTDRAKATARAWKTSHQSVATAHGRTYRARKIGAPGGGVTADQWEAILVSFNYCCAYCLRDDASLSQDHMDPIVFGGAHDVENVVPACKPCNSRKGARGPICMVNT